MKLKKTDQRSKFTQSTVKSALVELLTDTPLNKITVSLLCTKAQVNRGTFYNHFYDVYHVYETIEKDLTEEFTEKLGAVGVFSFDKAFLREIMLLIYFNLKLIRIILKNRNESSFYKDIVSFVKDKFTRELEMGNNKDIPKEQVAQVLSYAVNGSLGVITEWALSEIDQSPEEMASLLEKLNALIIYPIFKQ